MHIDLTLTLWEILVVLGLAAVYLIRQWSMLKAVRTWSKTNDSWVKKHEQIADKAMEVLQAMVTDMARVTDRLDNMERRVDKLEQRAWDAK